MRPLRSSRPVPRQPVLPPGADAEGEPVMSSVRVTAARLRQLADELPDRYAAPLLHLSRARVLTGAQLDRLLTEPDLSPDTADRVRRRIMTRLGELGLVATMARRVGGVRAESAGHVHVLTPAGYKLAAVLTGMRTPRRVRHSRAPGPKFVNHAIDIAEIYDQLTESSPAGTFRVAEFVTEPVGDQ
jgi:Replication-relaxation